MLFEIKDLFSQNACASKTSQRKKKKRTNQINQNI